MDYEEIKADIEQDKRERREKFYADLKALGFEETKRGSVFCMGGMTISKDEIESITQSFNLHTKPAAVIYYCGVHEGRERERQEVKSFLKKYLP